MDDKIHTLVYLVEISHDHRSTRLLDLPATGLLLRPKVRPLKYHEFSFDDPEWSIKFKSDFGSMNLNLDSAVAEFSYVDHDGEQREPVRRKTTPTKLRRKSKRL